MNAVAQPRTLDIGIGGAWVRLHVDSPDFIAAMADRFAGFIGDVAAPDHEFDVELVPPRPRGEDAPDDEVRVVREGHSWRAQRGDFLATWDSRTRRGHARIVASPYSLDSVIRILHTLLLAEEGGMLMHASSVVKDGKAWVFTGVSGVGKTTISRLAPPGAHVLTDEISFIRPRDDGYAAHGTPFSGDLGRPGENLSAPIAGVFLLAQGPENRIEPLPQAEAVRGLMANILYFARDEAMTTKVFDNAIALAARVPVRRLAFLPDPRVWDLIGDGA